MILISLCIDGKTVQVDEGKTVLEAAREAGTVIPTLCYHKDLTPYGGCRLCVVEIEGAERPVPSCTMPAQQGMKVITENENLTSLRQSLLKMVLSTYYDTGYAAVDQQPNELIYWANHYGLDIAQYSARVPHHVVNSDPNPFVWVDLNKCILCNRCVRACAEIQGRFVWGFSNRGYETEIIAGASQTMLEARCESCGACVAVCPTGALDNKLSLGLGAPDKIVTTICTYCGVGCTLDLNVRNNRIIRVTSNPNAPVNGLRLCVKGRYGYDFVHHPDRLTQPKVREYLLKGQPRTVKSDRGRWVGVDWDTALYLAASKLRDTRDTYGSDSIGILTSAKCTNEENYLMNKLARQVLGTNSIDHCARL
jgi:predicted molibdopterin-dependent oxidoreductase YjgC